MWGKWWTRSITTQLMGAREWWRDVMMPMWLVWCTLGLLCSWWVELLLVAMQTVQQCKEKQWARSLPVLLTVQWWWWKTCVSACMFGSALLTMAEASILAMQVCMQTVLQFNEGYAWKWWTRSTASLLMSLNDMSLIRVMSVRIALFRASWLIVAMQVHTYTNWAHIIGH